MLDVMRLAWSTVQRNRLGVDEKWFWVCGAKVNDECR